MIQKYGGASAATIPDFMMEIQVWRMHDQPEELTNRLPNSSFRQAMMDTTHNHPSVVQYTVFNEVCALS